MTAAAAVFCAAAAFFAAVVVGRLDIGSAPARPQAIEIVHGAGMRTAARAPAAPRGQSRAEVHQQVESRRLSRAQPGTGGGW